MSSAKWRPFCLGLNVLIDTRSKPEVFGKTWRPSQYKDDILAVVEFPL